MNDLIIWYSKDKNQIKYRQLYDDYNVEGASRWTMVELADGTRRKLTTDEYHNHKLLPEGAKVFRLVSQRAPSFSPKNVFDFEYIGTTYKAPGCWVTNKGGMEKLAKNKRFYPEGSNLSYIQYLRDFPMKKLTNLWMETSGATNKIYAVQTSIKVIARCLLMTTDPSDLVLDPTCGSGTTAHVAEQWGRRWITCDTSRVAVTLAKQRLMTALYDYYKLAHPSEGVGSGFNYKTVPHITLKSIANNEPPGTETLYDQPLTDKTKARVSGPFTMEAVPAPMVKPLSEIESDQPADESIARSGETLRQAEWRDELFNAGIRGKGGQKIKFSRVESLPGSRWLHADGETKEAEPQRVALSFGPEHAPLEQRQVALAIEEAQKLVPKPKIIVFASFQFDPEAAKDIDETDLPGVTLLKAQMNTDLLTDDLKKKRSSNESFWLIGQPDVKLEKITHGKDKEKYSVEVLGFDYYNTKTGSIDSGGTEKIAMWMLDTDYDGRSLFPSQVFFPMSGKKDGWSRLAKNLKAEIDEELIEAYRGNKSLPFKSGENKRIAVKIVDDRGIESLKIIEI
jgi:adenine-specific DNA-methyltransferase